MKMTRALKNAWLEGLRTLPQAAGYLHTPEGFCCLGVFQEVSGAEKETDSGGITVYDGSATHFSRDTTKRYDCLPAGFSIADEDIPERLRADWKGYGSNNSGLIWLNDNGATFEEIAALVEKYVEVTDEANRAEQA